MLKNVIIASLLVASVAVSGLAMPQVASATKSEKVTICHATSSHKNPYVKITVNTSSINEKNNKEYNGHGDHTGGVWRSGIADHSWGDIIPAFTSPKGMEFPGQNMDAAGTVILGNDCKIPTVKANGPVTSTVDPVEVGKGETKNPVDEMPLELPQTGLGLGLIGGGAFASSLSYATAYFLQKRK